MMRSVVAMLLFAVSSPALSQADAYARHWPLQGDEAGVFTVTVTPALYAQIQRADMGDLAAFNAAGEALAFGPLAPVWQAPSPQWYAARWFVLPATVDGQHGGVSMYVEKAVDGSIRLRSEVEAAKAPAQQSGEVLIDTGDAEASVRHLLALAFEFDPAAADFTVQVGVDVSDDLVSWRTVLSEAPLLRLQQAGQVLQRRQIDLAGVSGRYLRLRRLDAGEPLPLTAVHVQTRPASALVPVASAQLAAELVSQDGRVFFYRLPARIPIEHVTVRLARDNTVTSVLLASREGGRGAWRPRGSFTAFQLRAADMALDNEPLWLGGSRDREWRVETGIDMVEPPVLEFTYRPEQWLLLTQGQAPYVIAAGSTQAVRSELPLADLLAPLRGKYGADWRPPAAVLGEPVVVAGEAAIVATVHERWGGRALWLILIGSVLAIGVMVVRLLRERHPQA